MPHVPEFHSAKITPFKINIPITLNHSSFHTVINIIHHKVYTQECHGKYTGFVYQHNDIIFHSVIFNGNRVLWHLVYAYNCGNSNIMTPLHYTISQTIE